MSSLFQLSREDFRPGFNWVVSELALPVEHHEAIFNAVYTTLYDGLDRRLKVFRLVWPEGAQWPSGHSYLQESERQAMEDEDEWHEGDPLPQVAERELFKLLLMRFSCVAQRLYRNEQIRDFYRDSWLRKRHPFIEMNRCHCEEHALCGRTSSVQLSIEEGLRLMEELTCAHPACRCTFDPSKGLTS